MPSELPKRVMKEAADAVVHAQRVRKRHARNTVRDAHMRVTDITAALLRLRLAMQPIRSEILRFPYGPQTDAAERNREAIREASQAIQRERRKLWKMLPKKSKQTSGVGWPD